MRVVTPRAAGTVAETVSAYDKQVSDARYGICKRYVSRERLQAMLDREYAALLERLAARRGESTTWRPAPARRR